MMSIFKKPIYLVAFFIGLNLMSSMNSQCASFSSNSTPEITAEVLEEIGNALKDFSKYTERQKFIAISDIKDDLVMAVLKIYQNARKERKNLQDFLEHNNEILLKLPAILIEVCKKLIDSIESDPIVMKYFDTTSEDFSVYKKQILGGLNGLSSLINCKPVESHPNYLTQNYDLKLSKINELIDVCNFKQVLEMLETWLINSLCLKFKFQKEHLGELLLHEKFLKLTSLTILQALTEYEINTLSAFFQSNSYKILSPNMDLIFQALFQPLNPNLSAKLKKLLF